MVRMAEEKTTYATARTIANLTGKDPRTVERHNEVVAFLRTSEQVLALYDLSLVLQKRREEE